MTHPFLDLPPLSAERFAAIEDAVARLLDTRQDVLITQGEALLPLEGAIRAAAGPGTVALNVITGPYGQTFGNWLRDAGATVHDLSVPFHTAVTAEEIREAFARYPEIDFVSLVHAEAATGNTNPVAEIGEAVREQGALFYLDRVASAWSRSRCCASSCFFPFSFSISPPSSGLSLLIIFLESLFSFLDLSVFPFLILPSLPPLSFSSPPPSFSFRLLSFLSLLTSLLFLPSYLLSVLLFLFNFFPFYSLIFPALLLFSLSLLSCSFPNLPVSFFFSIFPFLLLCLRLFPLPLFVPSLTFSFLFFFLFLGFLFASFSLPFSSSVNAGGGALAKEMIRVNHYGPDATPGAVQGSLAALGTALAEKGLTVDPAAARRAAEDAWR
ncbi:hypothetical protein GCM10017687_17890 [Streptomyces echinatus]